MTVLVRLLLLALDEERLARLDSTDWLRILTLSALRKKPSRKLAPLATAAGPPLAAASSSSSLATKLALPEKSCVLPSSWS